ncbi:MAG TPA: GNAT family N-acetyltransferase [Ignavibacteria bacterium]
MENIKILPITGEDIDGIVDLWNEELPIDSINKNLFIAKVILDEHFEPENVLVAKDGNKIVGFIVGATVKEVIYPDVDPQNIRSWITSFAISKEYRKKGLGKKMLNTLLDKFKKDGKKECYIATYPYGYFVPGLDVKLYKDTISFLEYFGFKEVYRPLSMDANITLLDLGNEFKAKVEKLKSEGIEIISYQQKYILSYIDFMRSMTSDWYRVARHNLMDMTRNLFHQDQITIAVQNEKVIGYCQFEGSHFGPFGVADSHQGKGIGTILLGRTLEKMRMYGFHDAWVLWTDDLAAKVYSKFGFKETRRFVVLKKEL